MFESRSADAGTTWLVTRHPGAIEWAHRHGVRFDRHAPHLDVTAIRSGDTVIGSLPIHLAAAVCQRGARYFNLSLDLPYGMRGKDLAADALQTCNARIEEYCVLRVDSEGGRGECKFATRDATRTEE